METLNKNLSITLSLDPDSEPDDIHDIYDRLNMLTESEFNSLRQFVKTAIDIPTSEYLWM